MLKGSSSVWSHMSLCSFPFKWSALVTRGDLSTFPSHKFCFPGLFSRAFVLLWGLCLHNWEPFSCGFDPCQLCSAVLLWFVQTVLLKELCSRTCSQNREEQRWLYEDARVGGMSSVYASFCTGVPQGTVFSVIIWAVIESRTFSLAQRFVTPVTA